MPVPADYQRASLDFDALLLDLRDTAELVTTNQVWNVLQGTLTAFRRRLTVPQAILFAQALPPVTRALFVQDWDPDEPRRTGWGEEEIFQEIRALRAEHNFSAPTARREVAAALRRHVDRTAFERALARLPPEAARFWEP